MKYEILMASDDADTSLGDFFLACSEDMSRFLNSNRLDFKRFSSNHLNEVAISILTENIHSFLFLVYSHGTTESLTNKGIPYISSGINIKSFQNAFFYACACKTAEKLGLDLIDNGCRGFIGYNKDFQVWAFTIEPFVECANHGAKEFLSGKSIDEVLESMKAKYNFHIDNYQYDMFGAADLVANRNALLKHGPNFTINDLLAT